MSKKTNKSKSSRLQVSEVHEDDTHGDQKEEQNEPEKVESEVEAEIQESDNESCSDNDLASDEDKKKVEATTRNAKTKQPEEKDVKHFTRTPHPRENNPRPPSVLDFGYQEALNELSGKTSGEMTVDEHFKVLIAKTHFGGMYAVTKVLKHAFQGAHGEVPLSANPMDNSLFNPTFRGRGGRRGRMSPRPFLGGRGGRT